MTLLEEEAGGEARFDEARSDVEHCL